MLTKEKLDRHLAGQSTGIPFLTMKEENEQRHKTIVFNENNVLGATIDKLTSILGNLSTQNRQSKPFKPRVYQGRGQPLTDSGGHDQYYYNKNRNKFYDKSRPYDKNKRYDKNNQNFSDVGTTLEMIGIEVNKIDKIGGTLWIKTGHMTKVEVG